MSQHDASSAPSPKPLQLWSSDARLLRSLILTFQELRAEMLGLERVLAPTLEDLDPEARDSARNLVHYLALRRHDVRELQETLASLGLSSLGRSESCVLANLDAVLGILLALAGQASPEWGEAAPEGFTRGKALLQARTERLLGPAPPHRGVRIMVTMPSEAAEDYTLVRDMLAVGMDCMRINCAHDHALAWSRMVEHLRRAEAELDKSCRVLMDLGGPKLRTGPVEPGPRVLKWRPRRDAYGRVTDPARIWLTPAESPTPPPAAADGCLPVPGEWLAALGVGARIRFLDARAARRLLTIVAEVGTGRWAEARKTAYVVPGTRLHIVEATRTSGASRLRRSAPIADVPEREGALVLKRGDTLVLTRGLGPGRQTLRDPLGKVLRPATLDCTLPEVFRDVAPGERIWMDDGKIGGIIRAAAEDRIEVEITQAREGGGKLAADKGINLPDTALSLPALTAKDIEDLAFVAEHADLVGFSFVHQAADVYDLQCRLARLGGRNPGVVLKIETRRAFDNLPHLLLAALHAPCAGVMIARGDLAVECGYERLAEVQEEILWLCEAAHLPVIWATQVLEKLAKEGLPSRAEITDAAMGVRAECVMLNKGPHICEAIRVLDDILTRMEAHQHKKRTMLRQLRLADRFGAR
jgi:pyruvate kinase